MAGQMNMDSLASRQATIPTDKIGRWTAGVEAARTGDPLAGTYGGLGMSMTVANFDGSLERRRPGGGALRNRFKHTPEVKSTTGLGRELDQMPQSMYGHDFSTPTHAYEREIQQIRRASGWVNGSSRRGMLGTAGSFSRGKPKPAGESALSSPPSYAAMKDPNAKSTRKLGQTVRNVRFADHLGQSIGLGRSMRVDPLEQSVSFRQAAPPTSGTWNNAFRFIALEAHDTIVEAELRKRDTFVTVSSMFGLMTMASSAVVTWYTNPERESGLDNVPAPRFRDLDPSPSGEIAVFILNILTSVSTVFCLCCIAWYYRIVLKKKRLEWSMPLVLWQNAPQDKQESRNAYTFWQSSLSYWWFAESFVHFVHPMPFMDGTSKYVSVRTKTIFSYLQLWMLLRLYLILRTLHTHHPAYRRRFEILYNNQELSMMNFRVTPEMTTKLYFYENMWLSMLFLTFILFFVFGFALFLIERVEQPLVFGDFEITLFYVFTTSVTIGYGRETAKSKAGRIITVLLGTYGQVVLTFFIAVITNVMSPAKEEDVIQYYIDSSEAEHCYRVSAAALIQSAWKGSLKYKSLRGGTTKAEALRLRQLSLKPRKASHAHGSGRHHHPQQPQRQPQQQQRGRSTTPDDDVAIEMQLLPTSLSNGGDDLSSSVDGSGSTYTRSRRDSDTLGRSEGHSGGERSRVSKPRDDLALLDRAAAFGTGRRHASIPNVILTLDVPDSGYRRYKRSLGSVSAPALNSPLTQIGSSSSNASLRLAQPRMSQFHRDMVVVNRLQAAADGTLHAAGMLQKGFDSKEIAQQRRLNLFSGVRLRGTTRDDMPTTYVPTFYRRQEMQKKRCLPLYAPRHKSNVMFEAVKNFQKDKRKLAATKVDAKDPVLDKDLQAVGALAITLHEKCAEHKAEMTEMHDTLLEQLRSI
eukprot:gene11207-17233_t